MEQCGIFSVSIPGSLLSVSHSDLVVEQRTDSSLSELFGSAADGKGYLLQNELSFIGAPVFQNVVPSSSEKRRYKLHMTIQDI